MSTRLWRNFLVLGFGVVLNLAGHGFLTWQFWSLLTIFVAYGAVCEASVACEHDL